MSAQQVYIIPCHVCSREQHLAVPLGTEDIPTTVICPHCLIALGALDRTSGALWAKAARFDLGDRGRNPMWSVITNEDQALEERFLASPVKGLLHGDIFVVELASGAVTDDADTTDTVHVRANLANATRIQTGLSDFHVTRSHLEDPAARQLLDVVYTEIRNRTE